MWHPALAKILRVVRIETLWVDVPVPLAVAREKLSVGLQAAVLFSNTAGRDKSVMGKIIHIASVADSGTLKVRVEVPNPTHRPAGEHVTVSFPQMAAAARTSVNSLPSQ